MTALPTTLRPLVLALALAALPAYAQSHGERPPPADPHAQHRQQPATPVSGSPDPDAGQDSAGTTAGPGPEMDHSEMKHSGMDHSGMGRPAMDHSDMDHSGMGPPAMDHSGMGHSGVDHSGMDHSAMDRPVNGDLPADAPPRTPIPALTAADRAAAFAPTAGHTTHDDRPHLYVMADRLETWDADDGGAFGWEGLAWYGGDLDRLWIRSEGERVGGELEAADVEVFYGRAIARWWDAVAGVRHDFGDGPSRTFAAFGVMGLAPYKFEVAATGYLGEGGQAGLGLELEYETLFTNRLIGQWLVEAELWGRDDADHGVGSGLSTLEAGFRLRYELDRRFAPYVGVAWERAYGGTADLRRTGGHGVEDTRVVVGIRSWF